MMTGTAGGRASGNAWWGWGWRAGPPVGVTGDAEADPAVAASIKQLSTACIDVGAKHPQNATLMSAISGLHQPVALISFLSPALT